MTDSILAHGLHFLGEKFQAEQGFLSLSSPRLVPFRSAATYRTTFSHALILSCLNSVYSSYQGPDIRQPIVDSLLPQKSSVWSFNYWDRTSETFQSLPYPDDLDDTFCALYSLHGYDPKLITSEALAKIVQLLIGVEEHEGGPYRTWLVPESSDPVWRDVDFAVNCNVAAFLAQFDIKVPATIRWLENKIKANDYTSPYYPTSLPLLYFLTRFYHGRLVVKVIPLLESAVSEALAKENSLGVALATTGLIRFGETRECNRAVAWLKEHQNSNGSWEAQAFCFDPTIESKPHYAGSAALTTAFCLETLALWDKRLQPPKSKTVSRSRKYRHIYLAVMKQVKAQWQDLPEVQPQLKRVLKKITTSPRAEEIILLPALVAESLKGKGENPYVTAVQLGELSLWGWLAYTLYDAMFDGEGDPESLLIAIRAERELVCRLQVMAIDHGFQTLWREILATMEQANAWELTHCRCDPAQSLRSLIIPDYGNFSILASRSAGHNLASLATLIIAGYSTQSREVRWYQKFFRDFVVARQLCDEAHDWEADLGRGIINAVAAQLLAEIKSNPKLCDQSLVNLLPELREQFWLHTITKVNRRIQQTVQRARHCLQSNPAFADTATVDAWLLAPIERSIEQTETGRNQMVAFIGAYSARDSS